MTGAPFGGTCHRLRFHEQTGALWDYGPDFKEARQVQASSGRWAATDNPASQKPGKSRQVGGNVVPRIAVPCETVIDGCVFSKCG